MCGRILSNQHQCFGIIYLSIHQFNLFLWTLVQGREQRRMVLSLTPFMDIRSHARVDRLL